MLRLEQPVVGSQRDGVEAVARAKLACCRVEMQRCSRHRAANLARDLLGHQSGGGEAQALALARRQVDILAGADAGIETGIDGVVQKMAHITDFGDELPFFGLEPGLGSARIAVKVARSPPARRMGTVTPQVILVSSR